MILFLLCPAVMAEVTIPSPQEKEVMEQDEVTIAILHG